MDREWPTFVKRYLIALGRHAKRRWENSASHRYQTVERSMVLIAAPWEAQLSPVEDTREFVFLRDFFNEFHECVNSCQTLDLISSLSASSIDALEAKKQSASITYWAVKLHQ